MALPLCFSRVTVRATVSQRQAKIVSPREIEASPEAKDEGLSPARERRYPWLRGAGGLLVALALLAFALSRTGIVDRGDEAWSWSATLARDPLLASALFAAFVSTMVRMPGLAKRSLSILGAIPLYFALARLAPPVDAIQGVQRAFAALGLSALFAQGASLLASRGEGRERARGEFGLDVSLVGSFALLPFFAALTAALRPLTLDAYAYAIDEAFGFQPSALAAGLFAGDGSRAALGFVYALAPLAIALVHVARRRADARDLGDLPRTILALTLGGFALHHLVPLVGPANAFARFPEMPAVVWPGTMMAPPLPRVGLPSLPMAWALAITWRSRGLGPKVRGFALGWLALTIVASLGLGANYLVDLVVTVPFTALVVVLCRPRPDALSARELGALALLALIVGAWVLAFHRGGELLAGHRALPLVAMALTVALPWEIERRFAKRARSADLTPAPRISSEEERPRADAPLVLAMGAMFFVSGAAGLVYEVIFAKSLALTFGSTSRASTTVLATYMGGMAAGAFLGGRLARGRWRPLTVYAISEGGVALWCALSPLFLPLIQRVYVALASGADPSASWLGGLQVLLGALVLLPPTLLMGITLPVVAKQLEKTMALGSAIGLLYGANTLGAALSSLATGYFILPSLGLSQTTFLAVVANLGAAFLAIGVDRRFRSHEGRTSRGREEPSAKPIAVETSRFEALAALIVLTLGGVVTLSLEVVYIHLLAVVAGNSTYAFSLMLFAFLLGLGGGAAFGRRLLQRRERALRYLAWMQLGLAASVLVGVFGWEAIPDYFASFGRYSLARSFGARELIRAAVCCLAMIPPALFIGAAYPLAMACRVEKASDPIRATGRASAFNTLGNVTGAFLGAFVLVPSLGALRSLHLLAATALALGLVAAFSAMPRERWRAGLPALAVTLLFAWQPSAFDLNRLASGANVYFHNQGYGKVVDHAESADGGLTMVTALTDPSGRRTLTLLTNGKFQGDDSQTREMAAQQGFALFPLLHTTARERALVIGFGTGVSARTVSDAGFAHTDIVELSGDIYRLADEYFGSVNGNVLHREGVKAHTTDGRNFLLLSEDRYDVIGLELSSIWFAGAANLYNREFYQLVKSRLAEGGVLQQWVQLHRLSPIDLASIFASVRAEFEQVWLYFGGNQGVIVACGHDCAPTAEALAKIDDTESLRSALASYGGTARGLLGANLLNPRGMDAFLESFAIKEEALVSTDDNLFLEYSTPKGNVRPWSSIRDNVRMLEKFR